MKENRFYHYQKQEIVIDKSSEAAMKFFEDTVRTYFRDLEKTKIGKRYRDANTGEYYEKELTIPVELRIEEKNGKIYINSEENWREVELCVDKPDIDFIINAYRDNGKILRESCHIRFIRSRERTGDIGSMVCCGVSSAEGKIIGFSTEGFFTANEMDTAQTLRYIALDELPDTVWTSLFPLFKLKRANGRISVFDKDTYKTIIRPISQEIYEEFGTMPERLKELARLFFYNCEFEEDRDIIGLPTDYMYDIDQYDLFTAYDTVEITTKSLIKSMDYLNEMITILNDNNKRFFKEVDLDESILFPGNEMIQIEQVFFSKDFAILVIYYDNKEKMLKYLIYDECFGK